MLTGITRARMVDNRPDIEDGNNAARGQSHGMERELTVMYRLRPAGLYALLLMLVGVYIVE
jgi:hypothetical protein